MSQTLLSGPSLSIINSLLFVTINWTFETPRFVFVAFKPIATPNKWINDSLFHIKGNTEWDNTVKDFKTNPVNIEKVSLQLNNVYYPQDGIVINYNENDYSIAYEHYIDCCRMFGAEPQLTPTEWRYLYPIFCFDCSSQNPDLKKGGIDIKVNVKLSVANPNLNVYALMFEDQLQQINVINGQMTNIN